MSPGLALPDKLELLIIWPSPPENTNSFRATLVPNYGSLNFKLHECLLTAVPVVAKMVTRSWVLPPYVATKMPCCWCSPDLMKIILRQTFKKPVVTESF